MKILLTGASGFIGTAFLRRATQEGHSVAGLYRPDTEPESPLAGEVTLSGDLEAPPWSEIKDFAPECVIHAAWISTPGVYLDSPLNTNHLEWSRTLFERVIDLGVKRIVGLGTCLEYEIGSAPLSEELTPPKPQSLYARTKNDLRRYGEELARQTSISFAWTRIFYPFGPGEHPARLCSSLIHRMAEGKTVTLKTPQSRKDWIYIDDVAAALLRVIESGFVGSINIGTGSGITVGEMAHLIAAFMDREGLVRLADPPTVDPLGCVISDATRLKRLGWAPKTPVADGLQKLIEGLAV